MKRSYGSIITDMLLSSSKSKDSSDTEKEVDDEEKNIIRSWDEFDASIKIGRVREGPPRFAIFVSVLLLFISGVMIASKKDAQRTSYVTVEKNTNAIFSSLDAPQEKSATSNIIVPPFQTSEIVNDKSSEQRSVEILEEELVKEEENVIEEEGNEEEEEEEEEVQETKKEKKNAVVKEFGRGGS